MNINTTAKKIKQAINFTEKITGKNLTLPILSSILIIASGKTLKFRSTNLNLGIEVDIPVKVVKDGVVAVRGDVLSQIFSTIQDNEDIELKQENDNLLIVTKNNQLLIKSNSYEDFPTIPVVSGDKHILNSKKIVEGIKSVVYSCSISEIKPEMASVYIYSDDGNLVFVATDSFRLAEKKIKSKHSTDFSPILIPFKNINEILRILESTSEDIECVTSKNQISFMFDGIYITSRLIDGVFPDYKQIIPKNFTTEVVLLRQDFLNALKISNIFSDKFNQITFNIDPKSKTCELNARNNDIGENKTKIDATIEGEPISMSFNYKYIIDCFQSINQDSLTLKFNGSNKPLIIKGGSDQTFIYLVMPMNR